MQKRVAPAALRGARGGDDVRDVEHRLVVDAGVIARGLRAVGAVLGAAAGLDRDQRRQLHRVGRVMRAMHVLRAEQEIGERQREEVARPPQRSTAVHGAPASVHALAVGGKSGIGG